MVIAATNDTDVNIRVYEDAERRAMLVNVVDVPPLCNFILPAIVRTGPLAIAISTAGAQPGAGEADPQPDRRGVRRALRAAGDHAQRGPRLGEGHAAHLPGPQGVLRVDRERRARPRRAPARRRRGGRARPDRGRPAHRHAGRRPVPSAGGRALTPRRRGPCAHGRRRREGRTSAAPSPRPSCAWRRRPPPPSTRGDVPKGDVTSTARIAGIQAAKRTAELIPLCHPLPLSLRRRRDRRRRERRRGSPDARRRARTAPDGRRDGGDDRVRGRRPDRVRHGQGHRARRGGRAGAAASRRPGGATARAPRGRERQSAMALPASSPTRRSTPGT